MWHKDAPKASRNPWLALGIGAAAIVAIWIYYARPGSSGSARPTIGNAYEYNETLAEARRLSLAPLEAVDRGESIGDQDKKNLQHAAVIFDSLANYQPGNLGAYVGAGKIYQVLGNADAAINRLRKGLASVPPNPPPAIKDTAIEAHHLLSLAYFDKQDYKSALGEIDAAIAMFPGSPIYLSQRASILIQMRQYEKANSDLIAALKIDPNHKRSRQLMHLLLIARSDALKAAAVEKLNKQDYKGVVTACTEGLEVTPDYPPFLALRAAAELKLGEKAKAQADVDRALQIDPANKDAQLLKQRLK